MHRPPTVLSHSVVAELQTSPMVGLDVLIADLLDNLTMHGVVRDGSVVSVKHNFVCGGAVGRDVSGAGVSFGTRGVCPVRSAKT